MHVRFTTIIGMPVTDDQMEEDVGFIRGILIHPDTAVVEGFFVTVRSFFQQETIFLSSADIMHVGTRIRIRHAHVLSPVDELIRLQPLLDEGRPMLGQHIITESGRVLGRCADIQFETDTFHLEWLFPRQWFRWKSAVPCSAIVQVRPDAIIIRDLLSVADPQAQTLFKTLDPLGGTTASRVID